MARISMFWLCSVTLAIHPLFAQKTLDLQLNKSIYNSAKNEITSDQSITADSLIKILIKKKANKQFILSAFEQYSDRACIWVNSIKLNVTAD